MDNSSSDSSISVSVNEAGAPIGTWSKFLIYLDSKKLLKKIKRKSHHYYRYSLMADIYFVTIKHSLLEHVSFLLYIRIVRHIIKVKWNNKYLNII